MKCADFFSSVHTNSLNGSPHSVVMSAVPNHVQSAVPVRTPLFLLGCGYATARPRPSGARRVEPHSGRDLKSPPLAQPPAAKEPDRFTVTCNKIQLTLSQDRCVAVFRVVVAGRYLACVSIQLTLSQEIFTGVLIHRVTRPLRGSVSCGSGWSVPCVSIQLTLSQPLRGSVSCGSGWSVPCVSIQLTLSQRKPTPRGWRIGGVVHV